MAKPPAKKTHKENRPTDDGMIRTGDSAQTISGLKFKVKEAVTLDVLKFDSGTTIFIRFLEKIRKAEKQNPKNEEQEEITLAHVQELETGLEYTLVVGAVLEKEIQAKYPDDAYVGKCFRVQKLDVEGERWKNYRIHEIEIED